MPFTIDIIERRNGSMLAAAVGVGAAEDSAKANKIALKSY